MRRAAMRVVVGRKSLNAEMLTDKPDASRRGTIPVNKQLITVFIDDLLKRVSELRVAVQASDIISIVRIAHYLHGAAVFIDAIAMAQLCSALKLAGSDADFTLAEEIVTALEVEGAWLFAELNDRLAESA